MTIAENLQKGRGVGRSLVIDAHAHLGAWSSFYTPQLGVDMMVREMDRHGINTAIVSSLLAIAVDTQAGNDETLRAIKAHPGRFLGYVSLNPHRPVAENRDEYRRCRDASPDFVGIKLHPMWHGYPADGEKYLPIWEMAAEESALVLGHCWLGSEEPEGHAEPARYEAVARRFPEITILLGHSGGTEPGHRQCAALCHQYDNLVMDLCASEFSGMWVEDLLKIAPAEKVLFATDAPFLGVGSPVGRIGFSSLPEKTKKALLGGNIARVLRARTDWTG